MKDDANFKKRMRELIADGYTHGQRRPRYLSDPSRDGTQEYLAHSAVFGAGARSVKRFLAVVTSAPKRRRARRLPDRSFSAFRSGSRGRAA